MVKFSPVTAVRPALILAVALLVAAAPTTGPAKRPTTTFAGDDGGFSLKVPVDWIVPPRPDEGQRFTVWLPLSGAATRPADAIRGVKGVKVGGMGLRVGGAEGDADGKTDRQILRDLTGLMAANLFADLDLGAKHVAIKPAAVGELPSRQVRFVVRPGGGAEVTVVYVVAVRKGTEYVFNAAIPTDRFDALWPDVERVLASFQVRE